MKDTTIDQYVGGRIRAAREKLGMTQAGLAIIIGASEIQMARYEKGDTAVKPELMDRLAEALKVKRTYFLEEP